jgi:hypothetical protein
MILHIEICTVRRLNSLKKRRKYHNSLMEEHVTTSEKELIEKMIE